MRAALAARDVRTVLVLLQERGMSQRRLSECTGFTLGEIHEVICAGRRVVSYEVLARVADLLGVARWRMGLSADPPADANCVRCQPASDRLPAEPTSSRGIAADTHVLSGGFPPRWWDQPTLLAALAAHDFTTIFAHLRTLGLTGHDIATRTGLRPSHVDNVLAGHGAVADYDDLVAVCDGLSIERGAAGVAYVDPDTGDTDCRQQGGAGLPATWTGAHTQALRLAMRHTIAAFAARLGVTERTVEKWCAGGASIRPRRDIQPRLDALFSTLRPETRSLYARLLPDNNADHQ